MKRLSDNNLQKPNIHHRFSPLAELIDSQSSILFGEIRENLSQTIQLGELEPGFTIWSEELKRFLEYYGFSFTKIDHLKLINLYLSVLSNTDLNYRYVEICFNMLYELLRKTRLITRDELTIDWRILYHWAQLIYNDHDKDHALVIPPKDIDIALVLCASKCSSYFSLTATEEILNELRPQICLTRWNFTRIMRMFTLFLPVNIPPEFHNQGFQLWLTEFFTIWQNVYNKTPWEMYMIELFAELAWNNIGYIDWESWLSVIFTRILRGFSLPIGTMQASPLQNTYYEPDSARWIVAMIGNGSSCLRYLKDLLMNMKSFYHPSNHGTFQERLVNFLLKLARDFILRVQLERTARPSWSFAPRISHRLTDKDIADFVDCIKEYVFISIFNKDYAQKAVEACQYLSILRPESIVPVIIKKHFSSIDSMTEPHRFTAMINCLNRIARQIVQQTSTYSQGQLCVVPLLMSVLPGIDLNDMEKTSVTLDFLGTILMVIICVDCSSAIHIRNDLTDIEKEVCLSTAKFDAFINEFLNRIFHMIEILSANVSDGIEINVDADMLDESIQLKLTFIVFNIVQQCSNKIFELIRERMMFFVTGVCLSPKVRPIVSCLMSALVKGNPVETLKYFLPKTSESIQKIFPIEEKEDIELTWYLSLFVELVRARGDVLIDYKTIIMSVFHHLIHITDKNTYQTVANAAKHLLQSLSHVYSIDHRLTVNNDLPIRAWGQSVDFDQLQVQFHIPNDDELDFACEFINTFIYPELILLNEKGLVISNNERLRSLTIIESIALGCFRIIPPITSESIENFINVPSIVPYGSKYRTQFPISKIKENLRMRLLIDIGKLLDQLLENHSDDVLSIEIASNFYQLISLYYGMFTDTFSSSSSDLLCDKDLLENRLVGQGQPIRSLIIRRMELQIQEKELYHSELMTDIDKQMLLKLFELSINRYSKVRCEAQMYLFAILKYYRCSYEFIIDRIVQILDSPDDVDHDQVKGCLYVLLGNQSFFLLTKSSWRMKEKLWPLIARMPHANKQSTSDLYRDICKKIQKNFVTESIIHSQTDVQSYNNLTETLSQLIKNGTWTQQKITMSLLCLLLQKNVSIPLSCVKTFVDFLVHENIELRKFATKGVAALCRLQKPVQIHAEKHLDNISDYEPPKTQNEWEERCFLDKPYHGYYTWPKTIKYVLNKRTRYTQENMPEQVAILYNRFVDKNFLVQAIQLMILNDKDEDKNIDEIQFAMFKGLFRNFGLAFFDNFMEQLYVLIHEPVEEKQGGSHRVAAEIVAGMIRGSKHWTLEMLDILWEKLRPFLTEVCDNLTVDTLVYWNQCFEYILRDTDPRRMYRFIDFLRTLINNKTTTNIFNEAAHWSLIISLNRCNWRIPSIWCEIIEHAKLLLDHSSSNVRAPIANLLAAAFSFDIELPDGKSTHHQPNMEQFINGICKQLQQAIEIDFEGKKGLNLIKTVIHMHTRFYIWCDQPIKSAIIQLFPYLCEFESMEVNDETFKEDLRESRLKVGLSYLNAEFIDALVEQLSKICTNPKWYARRAAIEFVQNMVFCNLFNVRSHAQQLHKLVIQGLFDEQYEVRVTASDTLSGLYQCGYLQVTDEDLNHFRAMSQTNCSEHIVQRHGGILGLCSIVLSRPYDISTYVPGVLMLLCKHSHDSDLIQKSIKTCLSEFRRTHHDSWHEHRQQFTEDQLVMLTDIFISHSYYA